MKSGKILLVVFLVLASAIGIASVGGLGINSNEGISLDTFFTHQKTIHVKIIDSTGSTDKG